MCIAVFPNKYYFCSYLFGYSFCTSILSCLSFVYGCTSEKLNRLGNHVKQISVLNQTKESDWLSKEVKSFSVTDEGSTSTPPPSIMEPIVEVISSEEISKHICEQCGKLYKQKGTLAFHLRYECGKEPQFSCDFCNYKAKRKTSLNSHIAFKHKNMINVYLSK